VLFIRDIDTVKQRIAQAPARTILAKRA
jgi:hypothetical protein